MRRALADTILDLVDAARPVEGVQSLVRLTSLSVDVPLEVRWHTRDGEVEVLADLPRWRLRTGFDERPGRLAFSLEEGGST